jgi:hypothetical protein
MCELNDVPECAENDAEFFVWPKSNIPGRHVLSLLPFGTNNTSSFEYIDIFLVGPFLGQLATRAIDQRSSLSALPFEAILPGRSN